MPRFQTIVAVALLSIVGLSGTPARARYAAQDIQKVPLDRLIENLTKQSEGGDEMATINLARVHAMAYSRQGALTDVETVKEKPFFGYGADPYTFPRKQKGGDFEKADDQEKANKEPPADKPSAEEQHKAAQAHLDAAIAAYKKVLDKDPKNLKVRLGLGWCLDQAGKKDEAIAAYRKVVEDAWATEKDGRKPIFGSAMPLTQEASGYLKPLLGAEKDKAEIAELDDRVAKLKKVPRAVTPIAVPLKPGLSAADLEDRTARVAFDADGSGERKEWTWITPNAAWLVYDHDGSGRVDSTLQLFGNVTFWCFWDNGYDALRALDDNGDNQLTGKELAHLALWNDANGNGVVDPGEVKPLSAYGIVVLSCRAEVDPKHPERIMFSPTGVTFAGGETRPTFDLMLHPATKP